jgi:hypothetical protein
MIVQRGETFPNGCRYPCDPAGEAGEVINCFLDHQVPIFTTEGWKPIGKIRPGDMVLTHRNRFRPVLRLSPQPTYAGKAVKLVLSGTTGNGRRGILITPNHKFLMAGGSWKRAQDIRAGESVQVMASFCGYCGTPIPYWRKYCDHSCLSKAITKKQWSNSAHRENISRKASAQMIREYAAGIRDPKEIVKKARRVCFEKYGAGGIFAIADRSPGTPFRESIEAGITRKWGSRLAMLKKTAFVGCGKASWHGSSFDRKLKAVLDKEGRGHIQQFRVGKRRVDFYLPDEKLFIECDTPIYHGPESVFGYHRNERKRDLEILTQYPDHKIEHIIFDGNAPPRHKTFDLLTLNHAGTYAQIKVEISEADIVELRKPRRTYNFAVEEDESYIAKGFVASNCRCVSIPVLEG